MIVVLVHRDSEFFLPYWERNSMERYSNWVAREASEWMKEHVGALDISSGYNGRVPQQWDVVNAWHYMSPTLDKAEQVDRYLAVRMTTDEITAVLFKLRWG